MTPSYGRPCAMLADGSGSSHLGGMPLITLLHRRLSPGTTGTTKAWAIQMTKLLRVPLTPQLLISKTTKKACKYFLTIQALCRCWTPHPPPRKPLLQVHQHQCTLVYLLSTDT